MKDRYSVPDMDTSMSSDLSLYGNDLDEAPYRSIGVVPEAMDTGMYAVEYPEIYYKIQPFVLAACDRVGGHTTMPTREELLTISDEVYDCVCEMYPDIQEYAHVSRERMDSSVETLQRGWGGRSGSRFRRRGILRDFIDILLLNELFRRGRYWR